MAGWTVVGVDCASQDANIALARVRASVDGPAEVEELQLGGDPLATLVAWVRASEPVLLAIDAPLGWPAVMCEALARHQAGEPLGGDDARRVFRRATDRAVADAFKCPLDVGADRIAYAAFRALWLLGQIREATGRPLPLIWSASGSGVIEVYPAATMIARGLDIRGYKQKAPHQREAARESRRTLLAALTEIAIGPGLARRVLDARREDLLDAIVAGLAGIDFLRGHAVGPTAEGEELARIRREGWIWCRRRRQA